MIHGGVRPLAVAAVALGLGGCFYTFDNPVSPLDAGIVTGRLRLDGGAPGQTVAGATVDLLWSNLSVTLGASGDFAFLSLPDGTYTLRYRVPGNPPLAGERADVYLPPTATGTDSLDLGTIDVGAAGTVEGTVQGADGGAIVGAFRPGADGGPLEFEGFSTSVDGAGHYAITLPAGPHELWASNALQSEAIEVTAVPGQDVAGQDFAGFRDRSPAEGSTAFVGDAVLGDLGASASEDRVRPLAQTLAVGLAPAGCPACGLSVAFQTPDPAAGTSAVQLYQTVAPGQLYEVEVAATAAVSPPLPPVYLSGIPAIAGQSTLLRQIFVFSQATYAANGATPVDGGDLLSPDGGGTADAGLSDAGVLDAGPRDAGPVDAGPLDAGVADAGKAVVWLPIGDVISPAFVSSLVALPNVDGGGALVSWTDIGAAGGSVYGALVFDGGVFGGETLLGEYPGAVLQMNSLVGTTYGPGGTNAAVEWVTVDGGTGGCGVNASLGQSTNGGSSFLTGALFPPAAPLGGCFYPLAVVADPAGNNLLSFEANAAGFAVGQPPPGPFNEATTPTPPVTVVAADCAVGVCVLYADANNALWVGGFAGGFLSAPTQIAGASLQNIANMGIASVDGGGAVAAWVTAAGTGSIVDWTTWTPAGRVTPTLEVQGCTSAVPIPLLHWRGDILVICQNLAWPQGPPIEAVSLLHVTAPPSIPATAGVIVAGFDEPNGGIGLAAVDQNQSTLIHVFELPP